VRLFSALRTAAFRLTVIYAVLFVVSLAVILAIVIALVDRSMRDQLSVAAREDAALLARSYQIGRGHDGRALRDTRGGPPTYFFVRRADGAQPVADFLPPGIVEGPFEVADSRVSPPREVELGSRLIGYGLRLHDGSYVAAARDDDPVHETMEAVVEAATTAGLVALTLALLGGLLMSAISLRRVDSFDRTARAIFDGDLTRRMPFRGTGDEFDRLAASLNRMLDRISALMEGLRQVSTDVAHDLRTPLSRLRQRLEDLGKSELTSGQQETVDAAVAEADAILCLFAALVQIAKVEGGSLRSRFEDVDLEAVATEVGEVYQAVAEGAGHSLVVEAESGVVVRANRELLVQLIVNLVENAITHTPHGTSIKLGVARRSGSAVLTVTDDGPGIPPDERARVFGRFYRLDRSRSTPGTGLGLALVGAIAELHGAGIELTDNLPGARFTLTFPAPDLHALESSGLSRSW